MSKLAISNIAWTASQDDAILTLLHERGLQRIEISPYRDTAQDPAKHMKALAAKAEVHHISIVAMQALLFRHPELVLFGNIESRKNMLRHLSLLIDQASELGVQTLIFGSPKSKQIGTLGYSQARRIAEEFFAELATRAQAAGVVFCIEPTPAIYGADFMRTAAEVVEVIAAINNPGLALNFDIGAMQANHETIQGAFVTNACYIRHVHISEPQLAPIRPNYTLHSEIAHALQDIAYDQTISIEMIPIAGQEVSTIRSTLDFVQRVYGRIDIHG